MEPRLFAGRYELTEPLGESSWRALDTVLGREVLVRLRPPGPSATLSHPNIRRVFDHGVEDGEPYEVLEYAPGGTLAERRELPKGAAAALAGALAYAHAQGVTHGAIDADAILFDGEGNAKLSGFTGTGDPESDAAALDAVLAAHPEAAVTMVMTAATPPPVEQATAVRPAAAPPPARVEPAAPPRRRRGAVIAAAALALLLAGLGAAYIATSGEDVAPPPATSDGLSVPVPTTSSDLPTEPETEGETEAPPTTTQEEATTQATTQAPPTTSAPATTAPPPATTAPPPTTTEPPPTTAPPPTTEPPATTEQPAPGPPAAPPGQTKEKKKEG